MTSCLLHLERKGGHFGSINLDEGSIFNKGQGTKLSNMGPPYLCNNSNFLSVATHLGGPIKNWFELSKMSEK